MKLKIKNQNGPDIILYSITYNISQVARSQDASIELLKMPIQDSMQELYAYKGSKKRHTLSKARKGIIIAWSRATHYPWKKRQM